jgi:hypothetical protein
LGKIGALLVHAEEANQTKAVVAWFFDNEPANVGRSTIAIPTAEEPRGAEMVLVPGCFWLLV